MTNTDFTLNLHSIPRSRVINAADSLTAIRNPRKESSGDLPEKKKRGNMESTLSNWEAEKIRRPVWN